jgi:hypothetical protein
MIRPTIRLDSLTEASERQPGRDFAERPNRLRCMRWLAGITTVPALAALFFSSAAAAQVLTIDTSGSGKGATASGPVDRRYQQIQPTHVELTKTEMSTKTRLQLERVMQSEQGFAMRPFPRGHKGLTLVANGKLEPAGENYLNMVVSEGLCAKPGDRVVITDIRFDRNKIIFALNGGPDFKHRFLRHIEVGGDPNYSNPVVPDEPDPTGARLTLSFKDHVPELTGPEVKALLAPLISFDVKTPIQAFTDTLPPALKEAILNHEVWVGMSTDMVLYAKGQPLTKTREMDGQMPFEEWIYGKPPQDVDFVRINGNRVIRVEIAKVGEPMEVFTKDQVEGLMRTDGTPVVAANTRTIQEGDVEKDPNRQAPDAPPSLRNPGETQTDDQNQNKNVGVMRPVQPAKPHPDDAPWNNPDDQQPAQQPASTPASAPAATPASTQPAGSTGGSSQPASSPSSQPVQSSSGTN